MKTKKTSNEKKSRVSKFSFLCGGFQKMNEMMKRCCPGEADIMDCCSMMERMMGQGKEAEAKEKRATQTRPKGGESA